MQNQEALGWELSRAASSSEYYYSLNCSFLPSPLKEGVDPSGEDTPGTKWGAWLSVVFEKQQLLFLQT